MLIKVYVNTGFMVRILSRFALLLAVVAVLVMLSQAATAYAATTLYVSPIGSDSNPCTSSLPCKTIGHAIRIAANGSTIRVAAGHYYENLTIGATGGGNPRRFTIEGAGMSSTIIDGGGKGTVVTVTSLGLATISAVAIENGIGPSGGGITNYGALLLNKSLVSKNLRVGITNWGGMNVTDSIVKSNRTLTSGGGMVNDGTLTVSRSTIANNTTAGIGGGILNQGTLMLRQSTVANNTAVYQGGGIYTHSFGTVTLVNSTVASNSSGFDGGGIFSDGPHGVSLYNATIAFNEANTRFSGALGGGVAVNSSGSISLSNTILASNLVATKGFPYFSLNDCEVINAGFGGGAVISYGYNLVSTTRSCAYSANTRDEIGASPKLGLLQHNGGLTQTLALLPGSPAIDNGNPSGCRDQLGNLLTTDQRGDPRPHEGDGDGDNRCDIGAYEK
jgi:hypothetical protein